jgi:hypothetical protein
MANERMRDASEPRGRSRLKKNRADARVLPGDEAGREARAAETSKAKQKEGYGAVPNVTEHEGNDESAELRKAVHEYEEKKGDGSKTGG